MGLFKSFCAMCDKEIKFLGGEEVCEECKPYSVRFLEIKNELHSEKVDNMFLKDFLKLMLTKIVKNEVITEENKETWVKLCKDTTDYFDYFQNLETYQKYHHVDYGVIFLIFQLFSKDDSWKLKKEGYLNAIRKSLEEYIKFHQWKDVFLDSDEKVIARITDVQPK